MLFQNFRMRSFRVCVTMAHAENEAMLRGFKIGAIILKGIRSKVFSSPLSVL